MKYNIKRNWIIGISIFILLIFYLFKNLSESVRVFGFIFGIFLFYAIDHMFEVDFEFRHYIFIIIILSFGILLSPLYFLSESYDKMLHFIMPILASFLVFFIVDKQKISFQWKLLIAFMFILSFLAIHEIGEYLLDLLFDWKLQGVYIRDISGIEKLNLVLDKNSDTMIDMILGMLGGGIFVLGKSAVHIYKRKFDKRGKSKYF
ncbi:MAG: hypothetical protein PVJ67_01045 [Candidatus Pacearchaeota archaeon]|jgi:hypothetical protein